MELLPWLGYLALYVGGGLAGFLLAALSCAASKSSLLDELDRLRERNEELEAQQRETTGEPAFSSNRPNRVQRNRLIRVVKG
ncbi:cell division protein FtsB [Angulomicrobium tetraedrale]|uniref:Cell division protein FtsB n=1 Tax=Ancylobacter tetraedralis TaxID=217068 RepID=A0A839ZDW5_9HYPH|nr:hypothetical protein [Ancylobacter tetraedralis]MBB3772949.1 cell division protein FtsB [Ancylobacter tetraedralis]